MKDNVSHTHGVQPPEGLNTELGPGKILKWFISATETILGWLNGRNRKPSHSQHSHPLQHFMLGKVILNIEHPETNSLNETALATAIGKFLETPEANREWNNLLASPKPEDILTFHATNANDKALSIIPVRLRNEQASLDDLVNKVLLPMQADLSNGSIIISGDITLTSAAPDWLLGGASHGIGTTGPGAWPVEAPPPATDGWRFTMTDSQSSISSLPFANAQGAQVRVAILDTAPSALDLDEAYERWATPPASHPLLENLWGVGRKLQLHTGISVDLDLIDVGLSGHRYPMPDHGLFVAGIINSIAPQAELHLIKTFTPYGVSNAETIARALLNALNLPRPLIINCSFTQSEDQNHSLPPEISDMFKKSWQDLFNWIANQPEVVVVAAAGNDTELNGARHSARFPAGFDNVIGVGALPSGAPRDGNKFRTASYTNLSDVPPNTGYVVFGGEPGPNNGVRGIYTSEFPVYAPVYAEGCLAFLGRIFTGKGANDWAGLGHLPPHPYEFPSDQVRSTPNRTGWAWWAGTSFAAPSITGILANWCSLPAQDRSATRTDQAINYRNARLSLNAHSQTESTPQNEKVIVITQG